MFSKILKPQKMIQSLEIKYLTKNKPNNCKDIETKFSPKTNKNQVLSQVFVAMF